MTTTAYRPVCFVCGSEDVEWAQEYDYLCSQDITTSCNCETCGTSWYDDTAPITKERGSHQDDQTD